MQKSRVHARRSNIRAEVILHNVNGLITRADGAEHMPFLVWDISDTGLGLWVSNRLLPGERIKLTLGQPYLVALTAEVVWCDVPKSETGFRCGIHVTEHQERLAAVYESLVSQESPGVKP